MPFGRIVKLLPGLLVIGALVSCLPKFLYPTQTDLDYAQRQWPGTEMDNIANGMKIYTSACNSCHGLYRPDVLSAQAWLDTLPEMAQKAKIDLYSKAYEDLKIYILSVRERMVGDSDNSTGNR